MELSAIKNGARFRMEVEAGVLKAIAVGVMAAQADAGGADSPF
jgi:hypothetical protein